MSKRLEVGPTHVKTVGGILVAIGFKGEAFKTKAGLYQLWKLDFQKPSIADWTAYYIRLGNQILVRVGGVPGLTRI